VTFSQPLFGAEVELLGGDVGLEVVLTFELGVVCLVVVDGFVVVVCCDVVVCLVVVIGLVVVVPSVQFESQPALRGCSHDW
jgi:hypothetical protein